MDAGFAKSSWRLWCLFTLSNPRVHPRVDPQGPDPGPARYGRSTRLRGALGLACLSLRDWTCPAGHCLEHPYGNAARRAAVGLAVNEVSRSYPWRPLVVFCFDAWCLTAFRGWISKLLGAWGRWGFVAELLCRLGFRGGACGQALAPWPASELV